MKFPYDYNVQDRKKIRLIINTDAKNEADDQFAIVHALLTPKFMIKGIIAAHFGDFRTGRSMEESYEEIHKVLSLMKPSHSADVFRGAKERMPDESTGQMSEGSELIIREAMSDDPHPLFVIFLGPITDLAAAWLKQPEIESRLTAIWIGGGAWPNGGGEFNLGNDVAAANVVFKSKIPVWQVPRDVYRLIKVSIAELEYKVKPCGEIGNYLFKQLSDFNNDNDWPLGESWVLGDSPAVSLLLDDHEFHYTMQPAPRIAEDLHYIHDHKNRPIRVYSFVDPRFTLEDMYAKLALNYPPQSK